MKKAALVSSDPSDEHDVWYSGSTIFGLSMTVGMQTWKASTCRDVREHPMLAFCQGPDTKTNQWLKALASLPNDTRGSGRWSGTVHVNPERLPSGDTHSTLEMDDTCAPEMCFTRVVKHETRTCSDRHWVFRQWPLTGSGLGLRQSRSSAVCGSPPRSQDSHFLLFSVHQY